MNRAKVWLILKREYVESVRKKSFLFGLVATPAVFVVAVLVPILAGGAMGGDDRIALGVVDHTGIFGRQLAEDVRRDVDVDGNGDGGETGGRFLPVLTVWDASVAPDTAALEAMVAGGDLAGWIVLPAAFGDDGVFEFHAETVLNMTALENLEARLGRTLAGRKAAAAGLDLARIEEVLRPADMRIFRVGGAAGETDPVMLYMNAMILVMMLFFALIPTGQILMRTVIEEKSNRVVEVLLASVTPRELMAGKVLGLGAVGLTLLAVWGAAGALLALRAGSAFPFGPREAGLFLLYFLPGYFFYAALLGAVGSVCNSEREAQPFVTPISFLLVLPVMAGFVLAQQPDHIVARVLSFVPVFTPSLMLFRSVIQPPPAWEVAATWLTLVAATVVMFRIASKVFRVGILMTGKRPTVPEIARWVAAP